ncbi:hypothetical protein MPSEU_000498900 [Mayamaea pseudoterrestris]|nr:hypothetical protein MPSEU_000498900 [Mayamaea pseudoterrestris]
MSDIVVHTIPIAEVKEKNQQLRMQLDEIRARRKTLKQLGDRQSQLISLLETERNKTYMDQDRALHELQSELALSMSNERLLNLFMQWNALNDCFHISQCGAFGTINGLRLGLESAPIEQPVDSVIALTSSSVAPERRRYFGMTSPPMQASISPSSASPPIRVPWTEINAALGQVALLLTTLEKFPQSGIQYHHQLLPQGSTTKIGIRRNGSATATLYNLFHDDSFQWFGRRNFNLAIESLCECVMEAAETVQRRDAAMELPYALERVKGELQIGRLPVAIAFGQSGTEWTRAMKYLLTDIKHILTFRLFLSSNSNTC